MSDRPRFKQGIWADYMFNGDDVYYFMYQTPINFILRQETGLNFFHSIF